MRNSHQYHTRGSGLEMHLTGGEQFDSVFTCQVNSWGGESAELTSVNALTKRTSRIQSNVQLLHLSDPKQPLAHEVLFSYCSLPVLGVL